uniref:Peptidase_M13 domain-containing protein n=1 Tax=Caenorhabditis tropicalis TaxID=1561998 RepID=A0A1I7UJN0_9PELO
MLRDLPDPFALTIFKFYKTLNIMNVQKVRWHGCVTRINSLMPMATSAIYVKNHFDHEAKQQVEEMISLIMESFVDLLVTEDWLTKETKQFAKQKVNEMKRKIGYPDYLNDPAAVNAEYKTFTVYPGHYYQTKFSFYEQYQRDVLERITEPVDRERWVAGAALVNAFYSPNTNEIIFPAGILQPVFYSKDFPSSMNFGGIGVVIGHEITHGFDDRDNMQILCSLITIDNNIHVYMSSHPFIKASRYLLLSLTMSHIILCLSALLVTVSGAPTDCRCPDLMSKKGESSHDYLYSEMSGCTRNLTCYKDYETFVTFKWANSEVEQPADSVDDFGFITTELDRNLPIGPMIDIFSFFGIICENNEWYVTKYPVGIIYMDDGGSYLNHDTSVENEGKKSKLESWSCELA